MKTADPFAAHDAAAPHSLMCDAVTSRQLEIVQMPSKKLFKSLRLP